MGSDYYDDDVYEDKDQQDEEARRYVSPREITPDVVATIPNLDSEGRLNDLIEEIDQNVEVVRLRQRAELKAKALENLKKAHLAPRCQHVKLNDEPCGSPAVTGQIYCHFHGEAVAPGLQLPLIEDTRSFQVAMVRVCQQIANGSIRPSSAKLLLQALSLTVEHLRQVGSPRSKYEL